MSASFLSAASQRSAEAGERDGTYVLTYFGLWAKGPAPALALSQSGLPWRWEFPSNWGELKPLTPWGHLPLLTLPDSSMIGHEAAILAYIAKVGAARVSGGTVAEYSVSMQLMAQAEDIYQKLVKAQPTIFARDKPPADVEALWLDADASKHNAQYSVPIYLSKIEKMTGPSSAFSDRFTESGVSVGECKLFAVLHACKLVKPDVLDKFAKLKAFYARFAALEETKGIIAGTLNMTGPPKQYFVSP